MSASDEVINGWRECADPVELAAARAAGVEVERNWGYDWHPGTANVTAEQFAGCLKASLRYRVPSSWSWSPEPPAPVTGDDLRERIARAAACAYMRVPVEAMDPRIIIEPMWPEVADAVLAVLPPQPAPPPVPPADDSAPLEVKRRTRREVTDDFIDGTRTIREWVNGGGVDGSRICEELDAWLDYWGGSPVTPAPPPVPPWPGAVLSGLCDEDGVPTWLALAGQVPREQVRRYSGEPWGLNCFLDGRWVEVRDPRAVPEPETERVPWWDAVGRQWAGNAEVIREVRGTPEGVKVWSSPTGWVIGWGEVAPLPLDGTVEVLRRDGDR